MAIVFVGIDLAKNVFAVHRVNPAGKSELVRPSVPRAKLHEMIAPLPPADGLGHAVDRGVRPKPERQALGDPTERS